LDYHATVRELPGSERQRERLQHFASQALSTAELLAIILRSSTRGDNVLALASRRLAKYGRLPGLVRADFRELCAEYGMGESTLAQVKAALEIGRRLAPVPAETKYKIRTSADASTLVMLAYLDSEQMRILLLDRQQEPAGRESEPLSGDCQRLDPAVCRGFPARHHAHLSGTDPLPQPSPVVT
jgi:DNA repair protein RadC